jgi:class 3 adenylate cyclase
VMDRNVSAIHEIAAELRADEIDMGAHSSPDGAVTIMFCDAGGSAGDPVSEVRQIVERHSGSIVKEQGDGFMAAFDSAHAGLRCAVEMQRAVDHDLRVGVHSGFVIQEADDFFGRNVVLAARIADYAKGRQVLVSSALKEHTETDPTFSYEFLDDVHFKGLLGEHKIYSVPWESAH